MQRRRFLLLTLLLLLLAPGAGWGWWKTGHHVVANIAYDRLDKETRDVLVGWLRAHPRLKEEFAIPKDIQALGKDAEDRWLFLVAAEWPDLIRGKAAYDRPQWHYINNRFFLTDTDKEALGDRVKPNTSRTVPDGLRDDAEPLDLNAAQAAQLCLKRLGRADVPAGKKAVYLCWVLHIVGDVHQPCHSASLYSRALFNGADGDRGANRIPLASGENLHAFWDSLLGGAKLSSAGDVNAVRKRSLQILDNDAFRKAAEKAATAPEVDTAIAESFALLPEAVYDEAMRAAIRDKESAGKKLDPLALTDEYRKAAGQLARRRVAEAGYRLGVLLNRIGK
ncbi:MAG: S1/P1 nuclease [Gemmataceae bacterium]